jgi:hypothetical protein
MEQSPKESQNQSREYHRSTQEIPNSLPELPPFLAKLQLNLSLRCQSPQLPNAFKKTGLKTFGSGGIRLLSVILQRVLKVHSQQKGACNGT